jgi:Zn-dependent M28 family amino/carboxypeptidase
MLLSKYSNQSKRVWCASFLALVLFTSTVFGQQGAAVAPATTPTLSKAELDVSALVKVDTIREVTTALSDKSMEGRGTGQPGGARAAKYIADKFSKLGLKPLGDTGGYLQAVKFRTSELSSTSSAKVGDVPLKFGEDFVPIPPFSSDKLNASGGLVFVGYGVTSADLKRDELAGIDLKGKIAVVLGGRPGNVDANTWAAETRERPIAMGLMKAGATGLIFINNQTEGRPFATVAKYATFRRVALTTAPETPFAVPPIVLVTEAAADKVLAGSGITYTEARAKAGAGEMVSRDLKKTGALEVLVKREQVNSYNVAGVLEGSDAVLKSEAVVYTAHYDAFGVNAAGDIFPGAVDNALGVAEMISIAEAFAKAPKRPRRSIIFLAVTGEEYGLLGAEHWVRNPTWPIEKIAADLNFDGIGTETYGPVKRVVGFGAEHSELGKVLEEVLTAMGMILTPDPVPQEGAFYRSDHYAFVKKGVPALMFLGAPEADMAGSIARAMKWMSTDYHQPGDIIRPDWHWDGTRALAVVGLVTGMRVANADAAPRWLASSPYNRARGTGEPPPAEK